MFLFYFIIADTYILNQNPAEDKTDKKVVNKLL